MMRALLLVIALAAPAFSQAFSYQTTTTKATIYVPTSSGKTVTFGCEGCGASVYCSSASTATVTQNGTAPTATEESVVTLNGSGDRTVSSVDVKAFTGSNVGSGTTLKTYTVPAGSEFYIDLSQYGLTKGTSVTLGTDNSCRMFFLGRVK